MPSSPRNGRPRSSSASRPRSSAAEARGSATMSGGAASSPTRSTTRATAPTTCFSSRARRRRSSRSRASSRSPTASCATWRCGEPRARPRRLLLRPRLSRRSRTRSRRRPPSATRGSLRTHVRREEQPKMANINRVVLVGNLTKDPELRHTPSGTPVCKLRVAVNTRQKDAATGEWGDKPNYFDVTVWGNQGESCAQYLSKGRPVGVDGRLDWREWEAQDGTKRQAVEIIAESVQFLG